MEFINGAMPNKQQKIILVIGLILLLGNLFFGISYVVQARQIKSLQTQLAVKETNQKVADFLNLFVQKVLKSNTEVSFEDRLQLENAIRNVGDPELLAQWEKFTGGTNETQIQEGVKDLLAALAKKIQY